MKKASLTILLVISITLSTITVLNVKAQEELPTLRIHLISPSNTTHTQNTILLNFSIQKQPHDNIDYTIDYTMAGENTQKQGTFFMGTPITNEMSFYKNFTEMSDGNYTLTVSAKYMDSGFITYEYADRQTVTFSVDTQIPTPSFTPSPTPSPESESEFPTIQLLTLALTVIIGLGILAYSMKRRT